jgi:DNA-binding response OmpR family regulator
MVQATLPKNCIARVLIVDDDADGAKSMGMLLKMHGYAVEVVTDSTLCLSRLEAFGPEVVLLDIAMPKVCGDDLARQIRQHPEYGGVTIIAVSGYADHDHRSHSLEAGCNEYFAKPVDLAVLEKAILFALRTSLNN